MVTFENGQYSVPAHLLGARVFVRSHGAGPTSRSSSSTTAARARWKSPGTGRARPGQPGDQRRPLSRTTGTRSPATTRPRPARAAEAEFLAIGAGAAVWLKEAAAAGTARMNVKMADAVALAKIAGAAEVDRALGTPRCTAASPPGPRLDPATPQARAPTTRAAGEDTSLTQGTSGWAGLRHHRHRRRTGGEAREPDHRPPRPALPADARGADACS